MINKLDYWKDLEQGTHVINMLGYWRALELGTHDKQAKLLDGSRAGDTKGIRYTS